jgi:phosphopantothenoylcysteine decarboxylase/phosphopantothenate--cysteine ligase
MGRLAVITCGPSIAPIDSVRRITNFATGEIGTLLARELAARGFEVICFRGVGSTAPAPDGVEVRKFTTNESLALALRQLPRQPDAIFHAAALCDFEVEKIEGAEVKHKLSSRCDSLMLTLRPAPKILPTLRELFPSAKIIGWKYELDGNQTDALAAAYRQLAECRTDACVVNGAAYGPGFGLVLSGAGGISHTPDKTSLAHALVQRFFA